jgi:hypothetical protein
VQDVIYLSVAVAFFALTWALVAFAGRLETGDKGDGRS